MINSPAVAVSHQRQLVLQRRLRFLVAATISYNVVEAVVALSAGQLASSSALIGFGLDSFVEVLSAAAVAWQFAAPDPKSREPLALRLIAISFFGLALLVTVESLRALFGFSNPEHSLTGIVLAALSLLIMPLLSYWERKTGRELNSATAVTDSQQTLICTYLSAVLIVGLLLNQLWGWSWADPLAALVIAGVAAQEGWKAWQGDTCCHS